MHQNVYELAEYKNQSTSEKTSGDILEKACNTVDSCIQFISSHVSRYMSERMEKVPTFVIETIFNQSGLQESFHRLIFSEQDSFRLQQEIIDGLKNEILQNDYPVQLEPHLVEIRVNTLYNIFAQTDRLVRISRLASLIGQWGAGNITGQVLEGTAGKEIIEFLGGNVFRRIFQEVEQKEESRCIRSLEGSVTGLLKGIGSQINEKLSFKVAAVIYNLSEKDMHGSTQGSFYLEAEQELSA